MLSLTLLVAATGWLLAWAVTGEAACEGCDCPRDVCDSYGLGRKCCPDCKHSGCGWRSTVYLALGLGCGAASIAAGVAPLLRFAGWP